MNLRSLANTIQKKFITESTPLLEGIEHQIEQALNTIRKDQKSKKTWVLLLGEENSGKTSLIKQAGQLLTSTNHKTLDLVRSTKGIDWWIGENIVIVDPAAQFCMSTMLESNHHEYWEIFLKTLCKKVSRPFSNVCLVIDAPSLTHPEAPEFDLVLNRLQQQLALLTELQTPLCVNIVISQCDYINGFAEFFNSLSPEEQQQAFGFSIIENEPHRHFSQMFEVQFQQFMNLLNSKLFDRLHHEPNLQRRLRISEFTTQFERLYPALNKIIDSFPDSTQIVLNNLFFCSAEQTPSPIDLIAENIASKTGCNIQAPAPLVANQKALFIPGMIEQLNQPCIPPSANDTPKLRRKWQLISYLSSAIIIILVALGVHLSYKRNIDFIDKSMLAAQQHKTKDILPSLAQLKLLHKQLKNAKYSLLGFNAAYNLKQKMNKDYQAALKNNFGSYLKNTLSETIHEQIQKDSSSLYNTLRVYLMFTRPDKMQVDFVQHWIAEHWKHDPHTQNQLKLYLQDYLAKKPKAWHENKALVTNAQSTLQKQPLAQLAFRVLQNNYNLNESSITNNMDIDGVDLSQAKIADFYNPSSFSDVFNEQIPKLANSYLKGNWVIGKSSSKEYNLKTMTKDLRQIYVNKYLNAWQHALANIKFKTPKTYQDAINQIYLLTNAESPLWNLYNHAVSIAQKSGADDELDEASNLHLKNKELSQNLKPLQDYLEKIKNAPATPKAAFDAAVERFKNPDQNDALSEAFNSAQSLPKPLQQWQTELAKKSWHLILNDSKNYINTLWKTNVWSFYQSKINNHYPIFTDADNDISITDFNNFFGPGGVIQDFFTNIEPFVNMQQAYWNWKSLDGETIGISQTDLDMLIRASMIQKMFYTDSSDKPTIRFKLTPVDMSDNASQFVLNIGGQMIRYLPGLQKTAEASWPGDDGNFVTMRFSAGENNNPTFTATGVWAWLRLLDKATVHGTNDPKQYQVTFKLDGNHAVYNLGADNVINPYLPNILNGFRLPERL